MDLSNRIDAEYFLPVFLRIATALQGRGKKIGELAQLTCSAFYPAATHLYEGGDVPFLRCVDIINHPTITGDQTFARIPRQFVEDNRNVRTVKTGDIVITKVGTPCFAGIVDESLGQAAMSRTVLGLTNIDTILVDPYYLTAFLRSDYGFFQLMREREQQIQLQLTLDRVGNVDVFLPPLEVQRTIGDIMRRQHETVQKSQQLYQEAETMLLEALGLDEVDLSPQLSYTADFNDVSEAGRLDADYWQTRYTKMVSALKQRGHFSLSQIASFSNGATPLGANYPENGIPFLRIQNIGENRLDLSDVVYIDEQTHSGDLKRSQLKPNDVLITITGRIGTSAVVPETLPSGNINQHIVRMRIFNDQILPYYLSTFLNSEAGTLQTERESYGTTREALPYYCLERVLIPMAPLDIQEAITRKILDARDCENEASNLLESAKQRVEQLILGG